MTTPNTNQPDNTIDSELDRILDDLWSAAAVDTVNIIQKTKPKNSTYVSDNFWEAKSAIINLIAQEANKASGCPCLLIEPCSYACSCASPNMSGGCGRCCKYGSKEQRLNSAQAIADKIKQFNDGGK